MLKALWNILPASIGTVQAIMPLVKEIIVDVVRIIAILPFLWSEGEVIIEKINEVYDWAYGLVEKVKNFLLVLK